MKVGFESRWELLGVNETAALSLSASFTRLISELLRKTQYLRTEEINYLCGNKS
jgi:hypothetical protein